MGGEKGRIRTIIGTPKQGLCELQDIRMESAQPGIFSILCAENDAVCETFVTLRKLLKVGVFMQHGEEFSADFTTATYTDQQILGGLSPCLDTHAWAARFTAIDRNVHTAL